MNSRVLARRGIALAAAAAAVTTAGVTGAGADGRTAPRSAQTQQIASSVLGSDYKITLTAVRSTTDELAASVQLRVYVQRDGAWKQSDRVRVGEADGWFWHPLTGRRAVCHFSTAGTDPAPIAVSLLVTPSIGCSDTHRYQVRDGEISAER